MSTDVITPAPEPTVRELRAAFENKTEDLGTAEPAETPAEPEAGTPATEATETPEATEPEAASESDQGSEADKQEDVAEDKERDAQGKFKPKEGLPGRVQKKIEREIDRATAARKQAEEALREIEAVRAKLQVTEPAKTPEPAAVAETGRPEIENFDSYKAYQEAESKWLIEQIHRATEQKFEAERKTAAERAEAQQQQAKVDQWKAKVAEFSKTHDDYEDLVGPIKVPPVLELAVVESEGGPALAYYLAHPDNGEQLQKLISLANQPLSMARELGKIEAKITAPPPAPAPTKTTTSAPRPAAPIVAAAPTKTPDLNDPNISQRQFSKEYFKRLKERS